MSKWMARAACAMACAGMLSGCASGSHIIGGIKSINPLDVAVGGAALWAYYTFAQTPSWSATVKTLAPDRAQIELERSMFAEGGDGAASMVFNQAAKRWCSEKSLGAPQIMELVEYWEPTMLGATRRARGEIRCQPSA